MQTIHTYTFYIIYGLVSPFWGLGDIDHEAYNNCVEDTEKGYWHNFSIYAWSSDLMGKIILKNTYKNQCSLNSFKELSKQDIQAMLEQQYESIFDFEKGRIQNEYKKKLAEINKAKEEIVRDIEKRF